MDRRLVYDLPTRAFHWAFALLFCAAFAIAKTIDDDAGAFSWHMMAGLGAGFAVSLRVLWGFAGTRHARFGDFVLAPREVLGYFVGLFTGARRRWAGHNPASSWAAVMMMSLALGMGLTGWLMTSGPGRESFEDIHELLANAFVIVVALHVAGIVLHTLRHGDGIARSMVDGRKAGVSDEAAIRSGCHAIGMVFAALVAGFLVFLWSNFDAGSRALDLFGTTLQLGEEGHDDHDASATRRENDDDDD